MTTTVDVEVVKSTDDDVADSGTLGAVAFVDDEAQAVEESADAIDAVDSVMPLTAADVLKVAGIVIEVTDNEVVAVLDSTEIVGVTDVVVVGSTDIAVEVDMFVAMEIEFITYDGAVTDVVAESVSV